MKRIILLCAILLAGCVETMPKKPEPIPAIDTVAPRCVGKVECEKVWLDAQRMIEQLSGMRVRSATDNRITTYVPTRCCNMAGEVLKYPISENVYELRVSFECARYHNCSSLRAQATNIFNSSLMTASQLQSISSSRPAAATAPAEEKTGELAGSVERLARQNGCVPAKSASLIAKTTGVETYQVTCESGQQALFKCELRQCRMMN